MSCVISVRFGVAMFVTLWATALTAGDMPSSTTIRGQRLTLNGQVTRAKLLGMVEIYRIGLCVPAPVRTTDALGAARRLRSDWRSCTTRATDAYRLPGRTSWHQNCRRLRCELSDPAKRRSAERPCDPRQMQSAGARYERSSADDQIVALIEIARPFIQVEVQVVQHLKRTDGDTGTARVACLPNTQSVVSASPAPAVPHSGARARLERRRNPFASAR
jgi:hypothetical protein